MNAAHSLIRKEILANSEKCGVRLSATLESHLVSTTVRYLTEEVEITLLTTRATASSARSATTASWPVPSFRRRCCGAAGA